MAASRIVMHVDLDAFYVSVEQVRDPSLRGKPVVVGGDPGGRGVVATASYEARVFGVRSGMPLSMAKRLCSNAIFLRGDYRAYGRVSKQFHRILRNFSPLVEPGGLDEAYLDLTGCWPVIEELCRLAHDPSRTLEELSRAAGEEIRRRVRDELAIAVSVGVATSRSVAKVASDAAKPDGLLLVPPGEEAAFLAPRPLRELPGLGPKAETELARLGVRTLGQLAATPDGTLRALFGKWGPMLAERARGVDPTPVGEDRGAAKSVSREGTYAQDIDDVSVLRASLRSYAESVGADLRQMERRARCVTLRLRYGDFTTITRSRTLAQPTHSDEELYVTGAELLDRALAKDPRSVRLIGLGASQLVDDAVQLDLFDPRRRKDEDLLRSIDRVRGKFGNRALQTGRTFFDPYTGADDFDPGPHTGLSSQIGHERDANEPV